jgi:hypothetical protein
METLDNPDATFLRTRIYYIGNDPALAEKLRAAFAKTQASRPGLPPAAKR